MSELQTQAAFFKRAWNELPETRRCLFHVPNGGSRNKIEASQLKGAGVIAGVWDMIFIWHTQIWFIEIKNGKNKLTLEQILFRDALIKHGCKFEVFYDAETAFNWLKGIVLNL